MDHTRALVKARLAQERKVWRWEGGRPAFVVVCDLCGRSNPTDLHEVIVTRGDTAGDAAAQASILTEPCNLALLCNGCNVNRAADRLCTRWLVSLQLARYGLVPIVAWLSERCPLALPGPYVQLVRAVHEAMGQAALSERRAALVAHLYAAYGLSARPYTEQEILTWSRF